MSQNIEHNGRVVSQEGDCAEVEIVSTSACGSCQAAKLCNAAESKRKLVKTYLVPGQTVALGEEVTIVGEESMGLKAAVLAYVVPLILMLVTLLISHAFSLSDLIGGIAALVVAGIYFVVLRSFRSRLDKTFQFRIKNQIK
ncbi:MAG: SoxR reducing system RseC family protein [Bacteroidales bacterium]|nr:SoxR reducing system RseC family protein [Bacteroidales bacterium]